MWGLELGCHKSRNMPKLGESLKNVLPSCFHREHGPADTLIVTSRTVRQYISASQFVVLHVKVPNKEAIGMKWSNALVICVSKSEPMPGWIPVKASRLRNNQSQNSQLGFPPTAKQNHLSSNQSNNFLALLPQRLYKNLAPSSYSWSTPNHFWFGTTQFKLIFA